VSDLNLRPARAPVHFSREEIMAIDPAQVADAMAAALAMVSRGAAVAPVRAHIDLGDGAGTFLISGALPDLDLLSVKVINVRPQNPARGLERLQGSLTVFESSTGLPLATLDARAATEVRTAACSAVSLRLLARSDATVLTVFGTGPQAVAHLRAMTREREFGEIRIVGRNQDAARKLAAQHAGAKATSADEALSGAHVVVTATNSTSALFPSAAVDPGTHIAMVGSGSAAACEIEPQLLARAAAIEYPNLRCMRVDLEPRRESDTWRSEAAAGVVNLLSSRDGDDQVAIRDGRRYVPRLHGVAFDKTASPEIDERPTATVQRTPQRISHPLIIARNKDLEEPGGTGELEFRVADPRQLVVIPKAHIPATVDIGLSPCRADDFGVARDGLGLDAVRADELDG